MLANPQVRGIWLVDEFTEDGRVRPPLLTDAERWHRLIYDYSSSMSIQFMDDAEHGYAVKFDAALHFDNPQTRRHDFEGAMEWARD